VPQVHALGLRPYCRFQASRQKTYKQKNSSFPEIPSKSRILLFPLFALGPPDLYSLGFGELFYAVFMKFRWVVEEIWFKECNCVFLYINFSRVTMYLKTTVTLGLGLASSQALVTA
jgi:hypothetical protein